MGKSIDEDFCFTLSRFSGNSNHLPDSARRLCASPDCRHGRLGSLRYFRQPPDHRHSEKRRAAQAGQLALDARASAGTMQSRWSGLSPRRSGRIGGQTTRINRWCCRRVICAVGLMSFADDFHKHPLAAQPVEFAVEDLFPWPKVELPAGHSDDDFPAHDRPLEVRVGIIFPSVVRVL